MKNVSNFTSLPLELYLGNEKYYFECLDIKTVRKVIRYLEKENNGDYYSKIKFNN